MKKNVGISISKCLKSAEKKRRANQSARAILTAPTVAYRVGIPKQNAISRYYGILGFEVTRNLKTNFCLSFF